MLFSVYEQKRKNSFMSEKMLYTCRLFWRDILIFETYVEFHVSSSVEKVELSQFLKDQTNTNMLCPAKSCSFLEVGKYALDHIHSLLTIC